MPGLRADLKRFALLDARAKLDLLRAAVELAISRVTLARVSASDLLGMRSASTAEPARPELVERVAFAIPAVAQRVPWRADCLVQALAARRWLERAGVATSLTCGVRKGDMEAFAAHAWLTAGTMTVTGGDGSGYSEVGPG